MRQRPGEPLAEIWRRTRSCEVRGKSFMRDGRNTCTACGSSLQSKPTISTASATGAPRIVHTFFGNVGGEVRNVIGVGAQAATVESSGELLHRRLRQHL